MTYKETDLIKIAHFVEDVFINEIHIAHSNAILFHRTDDAELLLHLFQVFNTKGTTFALYYSD